MSDPFAIFKAGKPFQQTGIRQIFPELYNCLARLDTPQAERVVRCALGAHGGRPDAPPATARIFEGGPPACADHVRQLADRPGGWPLRAERK